MFILDLIKYSEFKMFNSLHDYTGLQIISFTWIFIIIGVYIVHFVWENQNTSQIVTVHILIYTFKTYKWYNLRNLISSQMSISEVWQIKNVIVNLPQEPE